MPQRRQYQADLARIREVFRDRRPSYAEAEIPDLIGIAPHLLGRAIELKAISTLPCDGEVHISWHDVVILALEHRWSYAMLTAALREPTEPQLPSLVQVSARRIALPRYQWQILTELASCRARSEHRVFTVSDLLEEAVTTAVLMPIDDWNRLEQTLPGVRAANEWPVSD
jgi:hypothetical protein